MANVSFKRGNSASLSAIPVTDGQLLYNTETSIVYMDNGTSRVPLPNVVPQSQKFNAIQNFINSQSLILGCIGDSITYGDYPSSDLPRSLYPYPQVLQNFLTPYGSVTVVNLGVDGELSTTGVTRFPSLSSNSCNAAIWSYGTNDIRELVPVETTLSNMISFVTYCVNNSIQPIVMTPPPIYTSTNSRNEAQGYLAQCIKVLAAVLNINCIDMYTDVKLLMDNQTLGYTSDRPDGVHFVDYTQIAGSVMKNLFSNLVQYVDTTTKYFLGFRSPGILTDGSQNANTNLAFQRVVLLTSVNQYYASFWLNVKADMYFVVDAKNLSGIGVFQIDSSSYNVNSFYNSSADSNKLIGPYVMPAGFHTVNLTNVLRGQATSASFYFYLSAFAFLPHNTDYTILSPSFTGISPTSTSVVVTSGATLAFYFYVNNVPISSSSVTWSISAGSTSPASTTSISSSGVLTIGSIQSAGTINVNAVYNGTTYTSVVTMTR